MRQEHRRNYKLILNEFLMAKGTTWRQFRDYLGVRHKISLTERMKHVAASYGISGGLK